MAIPRDITIAGKVYIKYIDTEQIGSAKLGDIMLALSDDSISRTIGDYDNTKFSGYFKARIFDGLVWHHIDIAEFCHDSEHKFAKKQKPIDTAYLCRSIIEGYKSTILYKTYRGHFSIEEYIPDLINPRRHPKWNKIKTKP